MREVGGHLTHQADLPALGIGCRETFDDPSDPQRQHRRAHGVLVCSASTSAARPASGVLVPSLPVEGFLRRLPPTTPSLRFRPRTAIKRMPQLNSAAKLAPSQRPSAMLMPVCTCCIDMTARITKAIRPRPP